MIERESFALSPDCQFQVWEAFHECQDLSGAPPVVAAIGTDGSAAIWRIIAWDNSASQASAAGAPVLSTRQSRGATQVRAPTLPPPRPPHHFPIPAAFLNL